MAAMAEDYGQRNVIRFAIVVVDSSGQVVVERLMHGADPSVMQDALASARRAVESSSRSPGGRPVFEGITVVGGIGVAGGTADQNSLAARAGAARLLFAVRIRHGTQHAGRRGDHRVQRGRPGAE